MDVIKSDYAGLKQVVASMGTQLSQEHITFYKTNSKRNINV